MERFVFFKRWGSLLSVRTALPVANYGRTHQINLIPPPPPSAPQRLWTLAGAHAALTVGVEVGEALGLKRARGGGGWLVGCVCVCMFRRWQLRILKQTTVICLKGSLSTVFELWQREGGGGGGYLNRCKLVVVSLGVRGWIHWVLGHISTNTDSNQGGVGGSEAVIAFILRCVKTVPSWNPSAGFLRWTTT